MKPHDLQKWYPGKEKQQWPIDREKTNTERENCGSDQSDSSCAWHPAVSLPLFRESTPEVFSKTFNNFPCFIHSLLYNNKPSQNWVACNNVSFTLLINLHFGQSWEGAVCLCSSQHHLGWLEAWRLQESGGWLTHSQACRLMLAVSGDLIWIWGGNTFRKPFSQWGYLTSLQQGSWIARASIAGEEESWGSYISFYDLTMKFK